MLSARSAFSMRLFTASSALSTALASSASAATASPAARSRSAAVAISTSLFFPKRSGASASPVRASNARSAAVTRNRGMWHGALTSTSASSTNSAARPSIRYATCASSPCAKHDSVHSITHPDSASASAARLASWKRKSRSPHSTRANTSSRSRSYDTPGRGATRAHTATRLRSEAQSASRESTACSSMREIFCAPPPTPHRRDRISDSHAKKFVPHAAFRGPRGSSPPRPGHTRPREPDPDRFRPRDPCPAPRAARAWNARPRHVTRVVASTGVVSVSAESQDANLLGENKRTR